MDEPKIDKPATDRPEKPRRDFLFIATGAVAAIGVVALTVPL